MLGVGLYNLPVCHHTFAHKFFFPPKLLFAARQCSWVKAAAGWGQGGLPSARQQVGWGGKGGGPSIASSPWRGSSMRLAA